MIGSLHILLLHLPIGVLLLAIFIEWMHYFKWQKVKKDILVFMYGFGALSAILACITGYILSLGYQYFGTDTNNHFWAGIGTAVLATVVFLNSYKNNKYQKWLALLLGGSLALTGHLGGSLTHGEGFLFPDKVEFASSATPQFDIDNAENAQIYAEVVHPILEAKCTSCHGPAKIKGRLRMDSRQALEAGGKSGRNLLGEKSEMMRRVMLPISNDKHMPPKEKVQLSEDEINILKWWIDQGASFDEKVSDFDESELIIPTIERVIEESKVKQNHEPNIPAFLPDATPPSFDLAALAKIKAAKIVALTAGEESNFLELNFVNVEKVDSNITNLLKPVLKNISRLQMSGLAITDNDLELVGQMDHLVKLYLDNTQISDKGLKHLSHLKYMQYLNINGTAVTNEGIKALSALPMLAKIYGYQTEITIDSLANSCVIIKGDYKLANLETDTVRL